MGGRRRWVAPAERHRTTTGDDDGIGTGAGTETVDERARGARGARVDGEERLRPAAPSRAPGGGERRDGWEWIRYVSTRARRVDDARDWGLKSRDFVCA